MFEDGKPTLIAQKDVLIVDDNHTIRLVLEKMLGKAGFRTDSCTNGIDAIELIEQSPDKFSFILLDMMMPKMDGCEVMEEIRKINPIVPIIMQTAHSSVHLATEFMRKGGTDFIEKPIDFDVLSVKMKRAFETYHLQLELKNYKDNLESLVNKRTRELLVAKNEAENASRIRSDFMANISHKMRTPMHSILSFSKFALSKKGENPSKMKEYVAEIKEAAESLHSVIDKLIDTSFLDTGKSVSVKSVLTSGEIIKRIANDVHELARSKNIRLVVENEVEKEKLDVDYSRIVQAILNIVHNAIQFSPEDSDVCIKLEESSIEMIYGTAPAILIKVIDGGCGIPDDDVEKVFETFAQIDTDSEGLGLGLAVSRQIIERHFGTIILKNNEGEGLTVEICLPKSNQDA